MNLGYAGWVTPHPSLFRGSCPRLLALLAAPTLLVGAPAVQSPRAAWRTIPTAHYRIHYPPLLADWAQDVAGRIEGVHAQVTAAVGYESPEVVQVVLADPRQEANGQAVPLMKGPFVTLWRTAPLSDDLHGASVSSWTELVVSHELTHIHHLLRPSRPPGGWRDCFQLPVGPLTLKAPRWVTEGYATLVEGRLTGAGRPHSPLRAAILRQWALMGKLPAYGELNGNRNFLGNNMAYLVGSAYLEWLERQRPAQPDVLQRLWKHLASRRGLTFQAAFKATFGFTPLDGYQRFQAETTHDALEVERRVREQGLRQGELWLRAACGLTDLAVSPDGTRLLARLEDPNRGELDVWSLTAGPKPPRPPRPDPLNQVEDAPPEYHPPKRLARLPALDRQPPQAARWVSDDTIGFQLKHRDAEGMLHRRPALWRLKGGLALAPDPVPPPHWRTLEPVHRDGRWLLIWDGQTVPLPGQAAGRAFVDEPRRQILAACDLDGIWDLVRVPYRGEGADRVFEPAQRLTRTASAAWNPAPSPDGRWLFFTSLDARGMEIRRLDLALPPLGTASAPEPRFLTQATVLPAPVVPGTLPAPVAPPPSHPYDARENQRLELSGAGALTPSGNSCQLGLSGQDLLGRLSWQVLGGFGDGAGPRGATGTVTSTAWAWKPSLQVFTVLERPSLQATAPVDRDQQRRGLEAALAYDDLASPRLWASPVLAWERDQVLPMAAPAWTRTRSLAGLRTGLQALWGRGAWVLTATPALDLYLGSTHADDPGRSASWNAARAALALRLDTPLTGLTLGGAAGRMGGGGVETFHLGGVTTSLVPLSLDLNRLEQPALPAYGAEGSRFLRTRTEVGGAFRAYLEGSALWNAGKPRPAFQRVTGVEFALDLDGPGGEQQAKKIKLRAGVHRPLDGEMRNRTVGTLTLVVRP